MQVLTSHQHSCIIAAIREHINAGRKIHAIKLLRAFSDMAGLKEAKDAVESDSDFQMSRLLFNAEDGWRPGDPMPKPAKTDRDLAHAMIGAGVTTHHEGRFFMAGWDAHAE
jgi:hypothetical protein